MKSFLTDFATVLRNIKLKAQCSRTLEIVDDTLTLVHDLTQQCQALESQPEIEMTEADTSFIKKT